MKLACSSQIAPGRSFREKFANIERYGFEGIEIRLVGEYDLEGQVSQIEQAASVSALKVCSVIVSTRAFRRPLDSEDSKRIKIADVKRSLDVAARLGCLTLACPEYGPQDPLPLFSSTSPTEHELQLLTEFLQEAAEYAQRIGIMLVLEPLNRYETRFYNTVDEALQVCRQVRCDHLRIMVDFFHMSLEEISIAQSIETAGSYIQHVHLADSSRLLPGYGHLDFVSAFSALKSVGYQGYMALECAAPRDPDIELPKCVEYLRTHML